MRNVGPRHNPGPPGIQPSQSSNVTVDAMINRIFETSQSTLRDSHSSWNKPIPSSSSSHGKPESSINIQNPVKSKGPPRLELPKWLVEPSEIPYVYSKAFSLVQSEGDFVDTNRASLLLLQTKISPQFLGIFWEQVNLTHPGRLVVSEFYALLALIACFQNGLPCQSVKDLVYLDRPVLPYISHPALLIDASSIPSDDSDLRKVPKSTVGVPDLSRGSETTSVLHLRETAIVGRSTESVVPCLDPGLPESSKKAVLRPFFEDPFVSQSTPSLLVEDDFDDFQSAPMPASSFGCPPTLLHDGEAPSSLISSGHSAVPTCDLNTPLNSTLLSVESLGSSAAHIDTIKMSTGVVDDQQPQSVVFEAHFDDFPASSIEQQGDKYAALKQILISQEPLRDNEFAGDDTEFGDFCSVPQPQEPNLPEPTTENLLCFLDTSPSLIDSCTLEASDDDFGNFVSSSTSSSSRNQIDSCKADDATVRVPSLGSAVIDKDGIQVSMWERCLEGCFKLLQDAFEVFTEFHANPVLFSQILDTSQATDYLLNLREVRNVSQRVTDASQSQSLLHLSQSVEKLSDSISSLWLSLLSLFPQNTLKVIEKSDGNGHAHVESFEGIGHAESSERGSQCCGICLGWTDVKLCYGGSFYHASCANLWLNVVSLTLPSSRVKYKITSV